MKTIDRKKKFSRGWWLAGMIAMTIGFSALFVSCSDDDYGPSGFYDNRLIGFWELVEYNGRPVYNGNVNYMYFGGDGRGYYYYYEGGRRYLEDLYYVSREAYSGPTDFQLNLQYGNGRPTTVSYWFEGRNVLCMEWVSYDGLETYVYQRIYGAPW